MTQAAGSDRVRPVVEAGVDITGALAGADAAVVIARRVAEALDVWECDLYEYDPSSRTLTGIARWARELSAEDAAWVGTRLSLEERPGYAPIIEGGRCIVRRLGDPDLDPADRRAMEERGELESLAVPLRFRDRGIVGCLMLVEKRSDHTFSDEDVELVTLLAGPAAVAVRNARLFRLQQQQNRYLASLLTTGRAMTASITLDDALARICSTAADALRTQECIIYEHDPGRDALVRRVFYTTSSSPPTLEESGVYPLDEHPSDRAILSRGMVVQETLSDTELPDDVRSSMERWGEKACLNVPLVTEGETLGILVLVETERERVFDAGEVDLARALGEQAATAIRHTRLYRRGERQNRRLAALLQSSRVLASSLDVDAVLGEVKREVTGLFGVPGGAVRLLLRRDDGFVRFTPGAASLAEEPVVELDEAARRAVDSLALFTGGGRAVVPFVSGETAEGLLDLPVGPETGADELQLLQTLASQVAAVLANAALYRTLERQAITDGLTGLYNHRYFYERLNQEIARAQRYGLPLSLLMIDIDDFKDFNDQFGHPIGDLALAEVGRLLSTRIRAGVDIAARYGGEEFAVVLPNTSRDGAHVVGTRLARELATVPGAPPPRATGAVDVGEDIRVSVAGTELPGVDHDTRVSVSIGIACLAGAGGGPSGLVRNADKALYLAKRLGKNRVEIFGD
jgi:diguanylate cyclase (GGDEF)-like protein